MKHAYLIMAYQNSAVLQSLLRLIDDVRNDIYIHIDGKTLLTYEKELFACVHYSQLYFTNQREKIYWAHYSQVKAEYILFEEAFNRREYAYYHLLSGSDLPIKSQDEIHNFFEINAGKEFIGFSPLLAERRIWCKHIFPKQLRTKNPLVSRMRLFFLTLQEFWYKHHPKQYPFQLKKGANWVSITNDFVKELLIHKNYVLQNFKYSKSLDEFYKQTIAYNSSFKTKLYCLSDEYKGCMRLIDWNRGGPYNWKLQDLEEIQRSDKLYCRKIEDAELASYLLKHFKIAKK